MQDILGDQQYDNHQHHKYAGANQVGYAQPFCSNAISHLFCLCNRNDLPCLLERPVIKGLQMLLGISLDFLFRKILLLTENKIIFLFCL